MSAEDSKAVAQRVMDRLDKRDLEGVLELCAPDSVWHGFAPEPLDLDGYRQAISVFLDAFPDSRFPVEDWVSEGDSVACRHSLQGTHLGDFGENPPTGNPVTVSAIAVFRVVGGKIAETWLSADMLGLMQQFGAIPTPGQAEVLGRKAMTEQKARSTVEKIQSFYEGFTTKGIEGAVEFLNEDEFSWHVPGENALSGVYHGVDGYKELGRKMSDADEWRFEVRDIIPNDDLALVLMCVSGERKGKRIDLEGAHVFRLDGAGKISEGWGFVWDQRTLDDFWS